MSKLSIGERVKYSASFIARIQAEASLKKVRGIVKEIIPTNGSTPERCRIQWDGQNDLTGALTQYITKA